MRQLFTGSNNVLSFLLLLLFGSTTLMAQFAGGSGTPADPYQITSVAQLHQVRNYLHSSFILMSDLDMSVTPENGLTPFLEGWHSIGYCFFPDTSFSFHGTFDGNGHVIRNLYWQYIDDTFHPYYQNIGLFAALSGNAVVKNLGLENVAFNAIDQMGAIAGQTRNNAVISNCYVTGFVAATFGNSPVGGNIAGGIVGINGAGCTIINCYALTNVSTETGPAGGIVGTNNGTITNCYAAGFNQGITFPQGGITGINNGTVNNCFWDMDNTGISSPGPGTGLSHSNMLTVSFFKNAGWDFVNESANGTNEYWNINGGYPYLSWQDGSGNLVPSVPFSGSGTAADPYRITTVAQLNIIRNYPDKHYILMNDLNLAGTTENDTSGQKTGWLPIGYSSPLFYKFTGSFDGSGHVIRNLNIKRVNVSQVIPLDNLVSTVTENIQPDDQGLFGAINGAEIKNLGLENVSIMGRNGVGAIAANSTNSVISNIYSTGKVTSTGNTAGGLVGTNFGGSSITNCYSTVATSAAGSGAGGLTASNIGTVQNCYSIGKVSSSNLSAVLGGLNASLTGTVTNSFWATDSSGRSTSAGGTGVTTTLIKTLSTFINAAWDFEHETANGTNNYWDMDTTVRNYNGGYPYLSWQDGSFVSLPVELSSFTASVNGGIVRLQWETSTEINNYGFEVQRLQDYKIERLQDSDPKWEKVGFVKGTGNSNSTKAYSFIDEKTGQGNYLYRLKQIDIDGSYKYSQNVAASFMKTSAFTLLQNYPNPFNPETAIKFTVSENGLATLKIYNELGQEVVTLFNEIAEAGKYCQVTFSAKGGSASGGNASNLASGIYYARLQSGNKQMITKMLYLK